MKKLLFLICILCPLISMAQDCKPDYSNLDKVNKQQSDRWEQKIFESSFSSKMINSSTVYISVSIGRYGYVNAINVVIQKAESSTQGAAFESEYRGSKGNEFYFGLKDGEPLKFIANEVSNQTKIDHLLGTGLWTTVVLSCSINNKDLAAIKDSLTQKAIDAVRIILTNNVMIDNPVKENLGNKMMKKFICFFNFLDEKGIDLTGTSKKIDIEKFNTPEYQNLLVKKDSISGKFVYSEIFEVKNTTKEEIYKRIKLNQLQEVLKYITVDFAPEKIVLNYPFNVGTPRYGQCTQTFEIKDNKFRYTISDIEYSEDSINWEKPEATGDITIIKWTSDNIPIWNKEFKEKIIDSKSDW